MKCVCWRKKTESRLPNAYQVFSYVHKRRRAAKNDKNNNTTKERVMLRMDF